MASSKFCDETRRALVDCAKSGVSVPDAARRVGVNEETLKGWLRRGRQESGTDYAEFVANWEAARAGVSASRVRLTEDELFVEVSEAARRGSVQAMKLYWEMIRADEEDEPEEIEDPLDRLDADNVTPIRGSQTA